MNPLPLFTIGFTQKNARRFFTLLRDHSVSRVIDVRLNNVSQIAGFAKRDHLQFFLEELCNADYLHRPECAPEKTLLETYKNKEVTWDQYVKEFIPTIEQRRIETLFDRDLLDHACLLCSEGSAETCHRRLVAEYLQQHIPGLVIAHL